MSKRLPTADRIEVLQGTLGLLILQTLQQGPRHGYAIVQAIRLRSREVLQIDTGALYPALHRLERARAVAATWTIADDTGQRIRVYRLTERGRRRLTDERSRWQRMSDAMAGVLAPHSKEHES
jgi:PadR family transcriptional regulator PadR